MKIDVLDHGYVEFVEAWGTGKAGETREIRGGELVVETDYECGIIEAARQSTQGAFRGWEKDKKLLSFLYNNKPPHASPFEFAGMVIEVQAPIFVFREWHRHRTQSYNEMSARYAPLPNFNYVPTTERCMLGNAATTNKQAQAAEGAATLTESNANWWLQGLDNLYDQIQTHYQLGLDIGIPKEVARIPLPVGRYSRMRASANLRNWLAFLTLRMDPGAQWEIRQYASAVGEIIREQFPQTAQLFFADREDDE